MNNLEFTILYLTCGAPIGVYFYLQRVMPSKKTNTILKSILVVIFWLPFLIRLSMSFVTKRLTKYQFNNNSDVDSAQNIIINSFENYFTKLLLEENLNISVFEFREIFNRYVGLTLENKNYINTNLTYSIDFYQIINHQKPNLATICLNRRNCLRLKSHQSIARQDILNLFELIYSHSNNKEKIYVLINDFAQLLNDNELLNNLNLLFVNSMQINNIVPVKELESALWNTTKHKTQPSTQLNLNLPINSTTVMMSNQD